MVKPQLCSEIECTGCEACKNSCPEGCIDMYSNQKGFLYPVVDGDRCIGCKKCENSCPLINPPLLDRSDNPTVYACWNKNDEIRMKSSSGGVFSAFAESVIELGGVVFGAAYNEKLHVRHIGVEGIEGLGKLRGSKYVQSEIGNSYQEVKNFLISDRLVFFVGTPCQIAGLYSFLDKPFANLVTADFICHGVPSPWVFKKYLNSIESKFRTTFKNINFRDKRHGWENINVVGLSDKNITYPFKGINNSFYNGFIQGLFLRDICYTCPVIGIPRMGDVTIADFWGVKKNDLIDQGEIDKGISLLMINHGGIGHDLIDILHEKLVFIEKSFEEAKAGNAPMIIPSKKPLAREQFFEDLPLLSYDALADRYLVPSLKKRIIQSIKENLGADFINFFRNLKKIIKS